MGHVREFCWRHKRRICFLPNAVNFPKKIDGEGSGERKFPRKTEGWQSGSGRGLNSRVEWSGDEKGRS